MAARIRLAAGFLAFPRSQPDARVHWQRATDLFRELGETRLLAYALAVGSATYLSEPEQYERAMQINDEALALASQRRRPGPDRAGAQHPWRAHPCRRGGPARPGGVRGGPPDLHRPRRRDVRQRVPLEPQLPRRPPRRLRGGAPTDPPGPADLLAARQAADGGLDDLAARRPRARTGPAGARGRPDRRGRRGVAGPRCAASPRRPARARTRGRRDPGRAGGGAVREPARPGRRGCPWTRRSHSSSTTRRPCSRSQGVGEVCDAGAAWPSVA